MVRVPARALVVVGLLFCALPSTAQEACAGGETCAGLDLNLGYTVDARRNARGGLERGNAFSGLLEAGAVWRTGPLSPGVKATTSISLVHVDGDGISGDWVGDLQGLNNIEADEGWYLYDLWTEFSFGPEWGHSVRAGLLDLNAEFDVSDTAGFFVGSPFGIGTDIGQTGRNGPAVYPVTGLGVRVGGAAGQRMQWRIAVYEGTPGRTDGQHFATMKLGNDEGALVIGEINLLPARARKIALGAWSYTARFERIDAAATGNAAPVRGNRGVYALVDAPLGKPGGVRVDGMLRAGFADPRFNAVETYLGGALLWSGLLASRPEDAVGIAVAHARTSRQFRDALSFDGGEPGRSETAVEISWRSSLAGWLAMIPGVQWVHSPGADHSVGNALVVGLRFEIGHERFIALRRR